MTTDPITEARRVLETVQNLPLPVQVAFSNLLTHVERLTAPVTGDRAELVKQLRATRECSVCDGYGVRERVDADPKSCGGCDGTGRVPVYYGIGERVADMLEADARREAALAEAIRDVGKLKVPMERQTDAGYVYNEAINRCLDILAKVSAEGVGDAQ